jgi:hypothetical protein
LINLKKKLDSLIGYCNLKCFFLKNWVGPVKCWEKPELVVFIKRGKNQPTLISTLKAHNEVIFK